MCMAAPLLAQVKCFEGEAANSMLDRPDASRYVFAHVLDDCGQVRGPHATQRALQRTHPSICLLYHSEAAAEKSGVAFRG